MKERFLKITFNEGLYQYNEGYINAVLDMMFGKYQHFVSAGTVGCDRSNYEYWYTYHEFNATDEQWAELKKILSTIIRITVDYNED